MQKRAVVGFFVFVAIGGMVGCALEGGDDGPEATDASEDALTTLTFSGPTTANVGACVGPFTLTRSSTHSRTLTLSGQGSAKLYASSSCGGASFTTARTDGFVSSWSQ